MSGQIIFRGCFVMYFMQIGWLSFIVPEFYRSHLLNFIMVNLNHTETGIVWDFNLTVGLWKILRTCRFWLHRLRLTKCCSFSMHDLWKWAVENGIWFIGTAVPHESVLSLGYFNVLVNWHCVHTLRSFTEILLRLLIYVCFVTMFVLSYKCD